ncbi:MAG TPA: RNA polymerase sigma factor [Gammaproteobacteria bacterium]|nr:RNA polymerase sigma factor [Gammaproteobacteria bacterium]
MQEAADETLMQRYRDGDAQAFEVLYRRHKGPMYRYLLRQCSSAALAEELFQDVWMNLIKARERYEPRARFSAWLYTLAHNRLVDHYRRQAAGMPISYDDDPDDAPLIERVADSEVHQPDNELDRRRQAQQLLALLTQLPEAQREAFLLRQESGLSLDEIATVTGVSMETAKSRLRYALAKLRQGMKEN